MIGRVKAWQRGGCMQARHPPDDTGPTRAGLHHSLCCTPDQCNGSIMNQSGGSDSPIATGYGAKHNTAVQGGVCVCTAYSLSTATSART